MWAWDSAWWRLPCRSLPCGGLEGQASHRPAEARTTPRVVVPWGTGGRRHAPQEGVFFPARPALFVTSPFAGGAALENECVGQENSNRGTPSGRILSLSPLT